MDKRLYQILLAFVIIGLLVSIYMTIFKLTGDENMCVGSGGCSVVNNSRYSEVNGIPVAVIGIGGYLALLGTLFLEKRNQFFSQNSTLITFGLSLTGFIFTVWLVYVELAILKAICPFCVTSQISMTIIFITSVIRLVKSPQS